MFGRLIKNNTCPDSSTNTSSDDDFSDRRPGENTDSSEDESCPAEKESSSSEESSSEEDSSSENCPSEESDSENEVDEREDYDERTNIPMQNEFKAYERTSIYTHTFTIGEKNDNFIKKLNAIGASENDDLFSITDMKNIKDLAGKIKGIEYKNPMCFMIAYMYIKENKKNLKKFFLKFENCKNVKSMNIDMFDIIRYITYIKNIFKSFKIDDAAR